MIEAKHHTQIERAQAAAPELDLGLRSFLLGVLVKTALGLGLAAAVALTISNWAPLRDLLFTLRAQEGRQVLSLTTPGVLAVLSPIAALVAFGGSAQTPGRSARLYWTVAATIGASLGLILRIYTGVSIATAFAAAGAGFGGLALYGYVTKRDLGARTAFLMTGLVGLLAVIGVNLVLRSPALGFAINGAGVLVFAGLIAHDLQGLKLIHGRARDGDVDLAVASNVGALSLLLNFVNLFQALLFLTGERR